MNVKEVLEMHKGQYADVEIHKSTGMKSRNPFHTDVISGIVECPDETEVIAFNLTDKEEYLNFVGANCDLSWEWEDCYEPDDKILLIKIEENVDNRSMF